MLIGVLAIRATAIKTAVARIDASASLQKDIVKLPRRLPLGFELAQCGLDDRP
jgi:hypothetical protein